MSLTCRKFSLSDQFIDQYRDREVPWGPLGYVTYKRTYARNRSERDPSLEGTEEWYETCRRVIEGVFTIQKNHCLKTGLPWNDAKAQRTAKNMYERLFVMKWTPPGRGLWMMGTDYIWERTAAGLFNCSFISTQNLAREGGSIFEWMMDALMLGIGVGFDTKGEGTLSVVGPLKETYVHVIPDSREGWAASIRLLIDAFLYGKEMPTFDYSQIREKGAVIRGFGGTSSGSGPLEDLHKNLTELWTANIGSPVTSLTILDTENYIGKCVVAGNIRRSAALALGQPTDESFLTAKNDQAALWDRRWGSNNSIEAKMGMDYTRFAEQSQINGEPGYIWLDNCRNYGRMGRAPDFSDLRVMGVNPCFTGDTLLRTADGDKTFRELSQMGDNLTLINYRGESVFGKVWSTGVKDIVALKFSNGQTIRCTPNHEFMLTSGDSVLAKDLSNKRVMRQKLSPEEICDRYLMYGFIQGDSALTRLKSPHHKGLEVYFSKKDSEVASLFGVESTSYITGFNQDLIKLGFSSLPLPERTLPLTFDNWTSVEKASFVSGLYSANGSIICSGKASRISLKSSCKELVLQLTSYLDSLGISSYYTTNKSKSVNFSNGSYVCKESYDLNISQFSSIEKFSQNFKFIQSYKNEKLRKIIDIKSPVCLSVKAIGEEEVFDFTLRDSTHWGVVEGGFVAHNCSEITLEHKELCNIVETFPAKHDSFEDYLETLKMAYLYNKTVTLTNTHWPETNQVMLKNRRLGLSQSGIVQNIEKIGLNNALSWNDKAYDYLKTLDAKYSDWLCIPRSKKITTVKPSGCRPSFSPVSTDKGLLYLHELDTGSPDTWSQITDTYVASGNGNILTKFFRNGIQPVYKITTSYNLDFYSTENHPWFIKGKHVPGKLVGSAGYVETSDLAPGMVMDFSLNNSVDIEDCNLLQVNMPSSYSGDRGQVLKLQPQKMSTDLAWLIGYYFGDGCLSPSMYRLRFIDYNIENLKKARSIIQNLFGVNCPEPRRENQRDAYTFEFGSHALYDWFFANSLEKNLSNEKGKTIPRPIRSSSRSSILAFIAGIIDSDGCYHHGSSCHSLSISTAYDNFAHDLQHLCWYVGLPIGRSLNFQGKNKQKKKNIWLLSFSREQDRSVFSELVTYSTKLKSFNPKMFFTKNRNSLIHGKIKSIELVGNMETFDVEVENQHWFYDGVAHSHNTVSLLNGSTPGVHFPEDQYYIRRIRFAEDSDMLPALTAAGYHIEKDTYSPNTVVVSFPVEEENFLKGKREVSLWEQMELAAKYQETWADNSVSVTVTFKPEEAHDIKTVLEHYESRLKCVSFLRYQETGYVQAPYEPITREQFLEMSQNITPVQRFSGIKAGVGEKYCDGDTCTI